MSAPELAQYYSESEDDGRGYKHPFRLNADGKPLTSPSVTTVLKFEAKDSLIQWAATKSIEWAVDNWHLLYSRSDEDALRTGKYAWKRFRDERASAGTAVHNFLEQLLTGGWDFPVLNDEQKRIIDQWHILNEEYIIEPVMVEKTFWNFTHDYVGTVDGVSWITGPATGGKRMLLVDDKKTSKNTWPAHWMQLSALRNCEVVMTKVDPEAAKDAKGQWPEGSWIEEPMPLTEGAAVIHLREDKFNVMLLEDEDIRFDQFLAYRKLWGLDASLKAREKERAKKEEW